MKDDRDLPPIVINGETFDVVKPKRLLPGQVLKSRDRAAFARIGPRESALAEQIHTASLHERGFPVAKILASGELGDQWYFIEESLGDQTFHAQFSAEYRDHGVVTAPTFARYLRVLEKYIAAQTAPANRTTIAAGEFVTSTVPDVRVLHNYQACGGDIDRYHTAMARATQRIADAPMGILQLDLNPFNILDGGIIDFELVGYGPIGYDSLLVSPWHRWFTHDQTSKYRIAYYLSEAQIDATAHLVATYAERAKIADPECCLAEFCLIKTAWSFSSDVEIEHEPASKQAFYRYRAALLSDTVAHYLANQPIDVLSFPQHNSEITR